MKVDSGIGLPMVNLLDFDSCGHKVRLCVVNCGVYRVRSNEIVYGKEKHILY